MSEARPGLDVVVVGAGPTGLSLAYLLGRAGVTVTVLERRDGLSDHPRAHWINTRTMELFRAWGIHDRVMNESFPPEHMPFDKIEAIGGPTMEERRRFSPTMVTSCAQDRVEEALLDIVTGLGSVTIVWGSSVTSVDDRGDDVIVRYRTHDEPHELVASYCLAADGAASSVRSSLGIEMIGDDGLGTLVNVYFRARLFADQDAPPLGYRPDSGGSFISMDGDTRWCFHIPYNPSKESPDDYDPARCRALIEQAVNGTQASPIEVLSVRPWRMTALVAERMRDGRVFLVGDAAHAFPPTGGLGMNSGVQDAHNLAWKLLAVLRGDATDALLDSYEAERQPVAFLNTAQSLRNSRFGDPTKPLPAVTAQLDARANQTVRSVAHEISDPAARSMMEMLEHSAAIGQELGVAYAGSPIVVDDHSERPDVHIATYVPNACPGARAPHLQTDDRNGSLLDEFGDSFVLLVPSHGRDWAEAAAPFDRELLRVVTVGVGSTADLEEEFCSLYGIDETGSVLVRPDGHVACRFATRPADPAAELRAAMHTALGHVGVVEDLAHASA